MTSQNYAALAVVALVAVVAGFMFLPEKPTGDPYATLPARFLGKPVPAPVQTCGTCHVFPRPDILPSSAWPKLLKDMNDRVGFYSLGPALNPADLTEAANWFAAAAPEKLPAISHAYPDGALEFQPSAFGQPLQIGPDARAPIITHISITDLDRDGSPDVLVCDATSNTVNWIGRTSDGWAEARLASAAAPSHAEAADLDGDGVPEIVVSCLGTMQPTEDPVGSILLLKLTASQVQTVTLASGLPRVADVRPADLDGDGDLDLAVALFGMYRTGGVAWLEQTSPGAFKLHYLQHINGVSHTAVGDLDGDGRPEIVALISQQHEQVIVLTNLGGGKFRPDVVFMGPHPLYGCSSLQLADLDADGDLDIIFTNGDLLDFDTAPKPYHGLQWLENRGTAQWVLHDIIRFPGAYSASIADLDLDGDLDIVLTSMGNEWENPAAQSIIWLENNRGTPLRFTPHPISSSPTYLVTSAVADLDGDGRPDILTGGMYVLPPFHRVGRITLWRNPDPGGPQ